MKFKISNLGNIKNAEIELGDFTIICGKNNTGKTYINHAIYQDKFIKAIEKFSQLYSDYLPWIFSIDEQYLTNASFIAQLDDFKPSYIDDDIKLTSFSPNKEQILKLSKPKGSDILEVTLLVTDQENSPSFEIVTNVVNSGLGAAYAQEYFPNPFIITSERTGIALFYKELDRSKNITMEMLDNQKRKHTFDFWEMFQDSISRYSQPVKDEMYFVRDLENIRKKIGELAKNNPEIIYFFEDIVGGEYIIENNSVLFVFEQDGKKNIIPLHFASSTVKSLLNMYFYLKHIAKPGDILMIDEPELNLHPENQRKLAKLFTRLVKCGLKLLMTTHSDYLIKELNNLIVLSNDFDDKAELMEKYKYTEQDILDPNRIKVYVTEDNTIKPATIDPLGIEVISFDEEIIHMNKFYDEVTYNLDIAYDY